MIRADTRWRYVADSYAESDNATALFRSHVDASARDCMLLRIDLVAGLRLGRARTAIERFDPHAPHQRLHMPTADLAPIGRQKPSQHPRSRKWELQMQPVETPHDREVGLRHWARQVVDAATADAQKLGVPGDRPLSHQA